MDYIILFLYSICKCLFSNNCWKNKLKKLLKKGSEKLNEEINIIKILKDLRDLKVIIKHSLMNPEIKF
jgi:hypothetical protein